MAHSLDTKEAIAVESVEEQETWNSGTAEDQYDMTRMGKKQEFRVGHTLGNHANIDHLAERK